MSPDDINSFVYSLTEYLNPRLPPEKYMGNFFDTDKEYQPLLDFVTSRLDKFVTKDMNYN